MSAHSPCSTDVAEGRARERGGFADSARRSSEPLAEGVGRDRGAMVEPVKADGSARTGTRGVALKVEAEPGLGLAGWLILAGLMVVGGVLRFWRLGELGLIVDEGYQATAVTAILEQGVPLMDSGYVYSRSFIFLYQQVLSTLLLGFSEWSMRLPATLWGLAGIATAAWFGRTLFGVRTGLVLAGLMAVSAWEVEFARYARFYTQFQVIYLVGLILWYRGFVQMQTGWRWGFAALFVVAVITHELGVMLGLSFLMVLPLRGYSRRRKSAYFLLAGLCGLVWKVLTETESWVQRRIGGLPGWGVPEAERAAQAGPPKPRGLPLPELWSVEQAWGGQGFWVLGTGVGFAVVAGLIAYLACGRRGGGSAGRVGGSARGRDLGRAVLLVGMAGFAAVNLVSGVMTLAVLYLAFYVRRSAQLRRPEVLLTLGWAGVVTLGWIAWHRLSPASSLTRGLEAMLSFPNLFDYFFKWMIYGWPATLVMMGLGFVALMRRAVGPGDTVGPGWLVLASLLVPMLVTSELVWQYSESRYFLHLYPLVLLSVAVLIVAVAERIGAWLGWVDPAAAETSAGREAEAGATAVEPVRGDGRGAVGREASLPPGRAGRMGWVVAGVAGLAMLASEDLNVAKAWQVSTRTYTSARDPLRSVLNFPFHATFHQDLKTGSEAARPQIGPEDVVVVVGPPHQAVTYKHYLGRIDFIVTTLNPYLTLRQQDDGYWMDLKSGGRMLYRDEDLQAMVDRLPAETTVWLFSDWALVSPESWYLTNAEPALKELTLAWMRRQEPWHLGEDGKTTVHRFRAGDLRAGGALPEAAASRGVGDE